MEEISENSIILFKHKCTFLSPFHSLPDEFDMDSHDFDLEILRNKANAKESLQNNLEHWHHIGANPSVIDATEKRLKNFIFYLLLPFQ